MIIEEPEDQPTNSTMDQAEAWKQLVRLLPIVLPEQKNKERVKLNFDVIKDACADENLKASAMFRRLKHAASTVVNELAKERFNANKSLRKTFGTGFSNIESSSSESSNEDEDYIHGVNAADLKRDIETDMIDSWEYHAFADNPVRKQEFDGFLDNLVNYLDNDDEPAQGELAVLNETDDIVEILPENNAHQQQQEVQEEVTPRVNVEKPVKYTCDRCKCPVSKASVEFCRTCRTEVDREKKQTSRVLTKPPKTDRICNMCEAPISANSKGRCKQCHLKRRSDPSSSIYAANSSVDSISGNEVITIDPVQATQEIRMYKDPSTRKRITCLRCNNDRVHFAQKMCQTCYKAFRRGNNLVIVKREVVEEPLDGFVQEEESILRDTRKSETAIDHVLKRPFLIDQESDKEDELPILAEIPNKRRRTKNCMDCQTPIYPESDRCKYCFWEHKKQARLQQSSSSAMNTSAQSSGRKLRDCLRCKKTISTHGNSGFCHRCYSDRQKENEEPMEPANNCFSESITTLTPNASTSKNNSTNLSIFLDSANKDDENLSSCVICKGPNYRRTTTGTCSRSCYRRFYTLRKEDANQSSSSNVVIVEQHPNQITEQTVQMFFDPPRACQKCWNFENLNERRLCRTCHIEKHEIAESNAKHSNKSVLALYLEDTEQFLHDE